MALDITLELSPEVEAAIRAQAEREGKTPADMLQQRLQADPVFARSTPSAFDPQAHHRQQKALLDLVKNQALADGDPDRALSAITSVAAETLEVERVSVWLYDDAHAAIRLVKLYERSRQLYSAGSELKAKAYPRYFEAIATNRVVAANDAQADPRTREFTDSYLIPHGITSMLDAPIQWGGRTTGIVCVEHVGARRAWTMEEEFFVASIADMVALAFEHAERRRAEEEVRHREIELDHQKELHRIKTNLIDTVTHELRTPLTSIVAYVEFLSDELAGALNPEQRSFVARIGQSAVQLQRLVDDLLDFARLEAGTFKLLYRTVDLKQRLKEVSEAQRPRAEAKGLELATVVPDAPVLAYQDAERFGQVLTNLISNAIKFTPEGGRVTVTMRETPEGPRVEVQDTGIGISAQHLPYLFERFYQVDSTSTRQQPGAGLGLSIVKSLVELMGGRLGVESELGAGSTFWFVLPYKGEGVEPEVERSSLSLDRSALRP